MKPQIDKDGRHQYNQSAEKNSMWYTWITKELLEDLYKKNEVYK